MALPFLDREDEQRRLRRFLSAATSRLAVVYGRRRCGKSTLIQRVCAAPDIYFHADEREAPIQIAALAREIARVLPGFDAAQYPSWEALFLALDGRDRPIHLLLDEFPYLVACSPELPSIIQRYLDQHPSPNVRFLLCGSSQHLMHGLALDRTAPLYGRANEILRITPLRAGWIAPALGLSGADAVEAWSVWGGVPRYWELASAYPSLEEAVRDLVLHRHGVLHDEPHGLLLDDMRSATQAASILALVGAGCHRLSEIAARLGKPAGSLTRPFANLIDLGYLHKDVPFGETDRSSKRTLYRIADPLVAFWFRFVQPHRSLLERDLIEPAVERIRSAFPQYCSAAWETLARESVPFLEIAGTRWGPASRWWGPADGGPAEFDLVAESLDGDAILVGEVKWSLRSDLTRWRAELTAKVERAPFVRGRRVVLAFWVREGPDEPAVFTPERVMAALR